MCLPLVKFVNSIFAFINLGLGAAVVFSGIYLKINKQDFWSLISPNDAGGQQDFDDIYYYSSIGIIIFGSIIIICSIFGIYGSIAKKKCSLTIYNIAVLILLIIFLGLGVLIIVFFNPWYDEIEQDVNCDSTNESLQFLSQANYVYQQSSKSFYCRNYQVNVDGQIHQLDESCTCFISPAIQQQWTNEFGADFFEGYAVTDDIQDKSAVTTLLQCPNAQELDQDQDYKEYLEMVSQWKGLGQFIEEKFECSGICDPVPFYYFSDINNGVPPQNTFINNDPYKGTGCIDQIKEFIAFYKDLALIISFSAFGFMFLNIVLSCVICCYSSKKKDPMAYFSSDIQMQNNNYHKLQ